MATQAAGGGRGRPCLASVNRSLTCALCKGYLVNAMTLIRCMHSFCKSCIHRHLDTSSACPTCQQRVFRSRMDLHMVPDTTLQSIVYKVVPGLFANEMRRRRDFYEAREEPTQSLAEKMALGEDCGFPSRNIFTEDDSISIVLEHRQEEPDSVKLCDRHLSCPAEIPVWVVIKFIRNKYSPPSTLAVHVHLEKKDIGLNRRINKATGIGHVELANRDRLLLDPDLTLIDVCYIADYKFDGPLRLSFEFVQFDPTLTSDLSFGSATIHQRKSTARNAISALPGRESLKNSTLDYAKYKMETKCIDMARGSLLNGGSKPSGLLNPSNKSKTYSRATTLAPLGQISPLGSLPLAGLGNTENTGDSTEEEEADNWDSGVSTTIDRTLTTQQQHNNNLNQQNLSNHSVLGNGTLTNGNSQSFSLNRSVKNVVPQLPPSLGLSSGKHSKSSNCSVFNPSQTVTEEKTASPIVTRPQTLKVGAAGGTQPMQQLQVSSLDNRVANPVGKNQNPIGKQATAGVAHPAPGPHPRTGHGQRAGHRPPTHKPSGGGTHSSQLNNASASIVEGKPPTVLKIKLNTSPTTSETLTITSPSSARVQRQAEKAVSPSGSTGPTPTAASPKAAREYPAVTSIKIKPIIAPSGPVTRNTPSPPLNARDSRAAALDARKKRKLEEEARKLEEQRAVKSKKKASSQAVVNGVPFVPEHHTDLLSTQNFGWGSAAILWESQLRIPSPLIVPFTVSFARRQRKREKDAEVKNRSELVAKRLRSAQEVSPQDTFLEANFGLKKQTAVVKEPQNKIWRMRRHISPPAVTVKLPPADFTPSSTLTAILEAIAKDKPTDSDTSSTAKSLAKPGTEAPTGNGVDADVFRMEFPEARVAPAAEAKKEGQTPPAAPERRVSSEVKFSINSILSSDLGQKKVTVKPEPDRQPNIQDIVEKYLSHISEFFRCLDSCSDSVRSRLQIVCADKKVILIKILAILRNISLAVVPGQSDRVLELAAQIQRHLQMQDCPARCEGDQDTAGCPADPQQPESDPRKVSAKSAYDVNRNKLPLNGVQCGSETKMQSPSEVLPGTSITTDLRAHLAILCSPASVQQVPNLLPQRKAFQVQDILAKEVVAALKKINPADHGQPKSAFELVTMKRSSSVSSLNTSDGSENFVDGDIEPNRWEDLDAVPAPRPWPGCTSEA